MMAQPTSVLYFKLSTDSLSTNLEETPFPIFTKAKQRCFNSCAVKLIGEPISSQKLAYADHRRNSRR